MLALLLAMLPTHATCPRSTFLDGVLPSGVYRCARPVADTDDAELVITTGRIWCRRGMTPINLGDGRSVRCVRLARGGDA